MAHYVPKHLSKEELANRNKSFAGKHITTNPREIHETLEDCNVTITIDRLHRITNVSPRVRNSFSRLYGRQFEQTDWQTIWIDEFNRLKND